MRKVDPRVAEIRHGEFRFIASQAELEALCAQLRGVPWLGLDTEFERSRTFYAELCLVQIAAPDVLVCIDPFAVESLAPLMDVLASDAARKFLHAARQDLEVLFHIDGRLPAALLDTQVAAGLAGFADNIGYADLVQQLLAVGLDKSQTRTDWRQRPLTAAQLDYAAADVLHLAPLTELLEARLDALGRGAWLAEDCAALLAPEQYRQAPELAWQRLRGLANLAPAAQARAVALAAWRESTAQGRNLPRGWVLKDDELMELAANVPANVKALAAQLPSNGNVRRHAEALIELLHAAPGAAPTLASKRLTASGRAHLKRLSACAQALAQQLGIAASILVTRRELEMLTSDELPPRLRDGWRGAQLAPLVALHADTRVDGLWEH
jgi:ribonuclease D